LKQEIPHVLVLRRQKPIQKHQKGNGCERKRQSMKKNFAISKGFKKIKKNP